MRKELLPKEKLFIFNVLDNLRQNIKQPRYTDEFADDGITEEEFNDMANNNDKMRFFLRRHLTHCGIRWRNVEQELEMIQSRNEVVKRDILPLLYNDNEEIPEHFKVIQPVIVEMLDKHFNNKELTESDNDKLWLTDAGNADARLAVEAFFEFREGKRDIRKCVQCGNLFLPTPRGRNQKYCSGRCRRRDFYEKYEKKKL